MSPLMRRALATVLLALLVAPAAAGAQAPAPLPPLDYAGPSASIARGAPLTFAVRTPAPAGSVIVRVSGADDVDLNGLLAGPEGTLLDETATPAADGLQVWSVPATSVLRQRPGHYFWQAYLAGDAAAGAEEPIGPVRELNVTLPMADRGRGKLFPRFGRRSGAEFYLSSTSFPATVDGLRFEALAKKTASRWGLKALRWTDVEAGVRDGFSVAGFSTKVPKGTLGVETDFIKRGRVVERDLALRTDENWSAGPDYPGLDQVDLESVLLHELGHMAGNKRHKTRCSNSPMIESLGAGEWWRGARDHWFGECASGARAASVGTLVHRVVRID
jgi:hypothetical protein